ncbi:MAG: VWA domain-containing protein, partial [Planctomycetaceae bacterium]|nr:VWA domain-containing protein [Planctomycetaceae bacterium]
MFRIALSAIAMGLATFGICCQVQAKDEKPKTSVEKTAVKKVDQDGPLVQMAILLDNSGSMSGLINQARQHLWKIVNEFATVRRDGKEPRLRVALYKYANGKPEQLVEFTDDLDKVSELLFATRIEGGSEYCGQVIQAAVDDLDWSKDEADLKCIFIAGNEPFTQGPVDYKGACKNAIAKGITVSTIFCGNETQGINGKWQESEVR